MTIFDYFPDNGLLAYGIAVGGMLGLGFSLTYFFDYNSDIDTIEESVSEIVSQATLGTKSSAATIRPIPSIDVNIINNRDIIQYNAEEALFDLKIHEINTIYNQEIFDNAINQADLHHIVL